MSKRAGTAFVAVAFALGLAPAVAAPASAEVPAAAVEADGLIVKLREGSAASGKDVASSVGGKVLAPLARNRVVVSSGGKGLARAIGQLERDPRVEWVEPNHRYTATVQPDDPCLSTCFGSARQWGPALVKAPAAWDVTTGSAAVRVAVIDGGVDAAHPDLTGKVLPEVNRAPTSVDSCRDHGTHVAGTVAAVTDNASGVAGLGWNTMVMSFRVLHEVYNPQTKRIECSGTTSSIAASIDDAVAQGVKVVNLSLSSEFASRTLDESIRAASRAGVLVVAAAGNSGDNGNPVQYPAATPEVLSVAATTSTDRTAYFSQRGAWVDMAAPGEMILSTYPDSSFGYSSGTSMAAPHVAAAAALVFAHVPGITGTEVANRLQFWSDSYAGSAKDVRYGRLNMHAALTANEARPWTNGPGYWMVATDGGIFSFGASPFYGSTGSIKLNKPILGMTTTTRRNGYWFVASDGGVFAYGQAGFYGSMGGQPLKKPVVGMASSPTGFGYWLAGADGAVYRFGDAPEHGSMADKPLPAPIVGIAATPSGTGYWLVGADGSVYSFGDARFFGSMRGIPLNRPVVGMSPTASGQGYWLVATDGGIFAFGDAGFHGSTGSIALNQPIVGMRATADGKGYWLVASDGGIFAFDVPFFGSMGGTPLNKPVVGMA